MKILSQVLCSLLASASSSSLLKIPQIRKNRLSDEDSLDSLGRCVCIPR